jgi:hypothetical protein
MQIRQFIYRGSRLIVSCGVLLAALAGLVVLCVPASAQSAPEAAAPSGASANPDGGRRGRNGGADAGPVLPTPRTADGKPDLSGVWDGGGGYINKEIPGGQLPYTPAGVAAYQYNMTQAPDPQSVCIIVGQPRADMDNRPFEIVQSPDRVAFLYERDATFRVIRVDGSSHPADPELTFFGDAVAKWDGDTLVVDVTALKGDKVWSDNVGHPHSDQTHLIERWSRPDKNHLFLDLTIEDPKYYTKPIHVTRTSRLQSWPGVGEEACDENNVDGAHLGPGLGTKDGTRGFDKSAVQRSATSPATTNQ